MPTSCTLYNEAKCTLINYSKSRVVLPSTNVETDMHKKIKAKDLNAMFLWTCIKTQITALYIPLNSTQNVHFYCALLLNYNKNSLLLDYEKGCASSKYAIDRQQTCFVINVSGKNKIMIFKMAFAVYRLLSIDNFNLHWCNFFCLSNCMSLNTLTFFNNSSEQTLVSCRISEK